MDLAHVQQQCGSTIEKAFYYDCTDEKKPSETEAAFSLRKSEEQKFLEAIQSYRGDAGGPPAEGS